jgi:hypothetical protein
MFCGMLLLGCEARFEEWNTGGGKFIVIGQRFPGASMGLSPVKW